MDMDSDGGFFHFDGGEPWNDMPGPDNGADSLS
jgi:hypothetical protein